MPVPLAIDTDPGIGDALALLRGTGVVVHDALALIEAIAPGTPGTVRRDVVVETTLGSDRGQTLVERLASLDRS